MKDQQKTKAHLISELSELRQENAVLRASEANLTRVAEKLQEQQSELAKQVIKRTTDLVDINKQLQEAILKRERIEETLRQNIAELQVRNEDLDAFAHTVAHDLKNPIGALTGLAEIVSEDYSNLSSEILEEYLQAIVRSGRKAVLIVDELLLLAQLRRQEVVTTPLDMTAILTEVQLRLSTIIAEHQAKIILPDTWPVALGYEPWVEEVWINYCSNAIKYGGRPPHLKLGSKTIPDGQIYFYVCDNGAGLTPEERDKLFTPFTQLNNHNRPKGYGLGLSIAQRIVEKLGGTVGVEDKGLLGHGSTFFFTLPAA